jgi:hypothetical protein
MDSVVPFVGVPEKLLRVLGEQIPGTRMYRKSGPEDQLAAWSDVVFQVVGHCVSPGGAAMRVGVSRAAVHQRLKDGALTGFFYYSTKGRRTLFGGKQPKRTLEVGFIPVLECNEWRKELEERAIERGVITREQLEGNRPEWSETFLEWNSKFVKQRQKEKAK